jgi:cell division protein FtsB
VKKQKRLGLATKIFVAAFAVYAAVTLVSLQVKINDREADQAELENRLAAQQTRNAELEDVIAGAPSAAYIAKIARESLDYIAPGEQVFVDISSK